MSLVFQLNLSCFLLNSFSVQTFRLPIEDALVSGQGRTQDFPRISFTSRDRYYEKTFRKRLNVCLLYTKAPE